MSGQASKEVEEFIRTKVAQEVISKLDPELINRFLQEIITEEIQRIIGSYDLRKLAGEAVENLAKEKIQLATQEVLNQPDILEKIKSTVNSCVRDRIDDLDVAVKKKIARALEYL